MITIRALLPTDWESVKQIYLEGIATKNATFQTEAPSWEDWDKGHIAQLRYVSILNNEVVAWAALSPTSSRCVYRGVAEVSIYISDTARGKGIGTELLGHLINESEQQGIWSLQAGIFPENTASIKLHEKLGFRIMGYREKVGKMDDTWRNVNLLERRSKVAGIG